MKTKKTLFEGGCGGEKKTLQFLRGGVGGKKFEGCVRLYKKYFSWGGGWGWTKKIILRGLLLALFTASQFAELTIARVMVNNYLDSLESSPRPSIYLATAQWQPQKGPI